MKNKMELKQLIGNNAYWTINKAIAKKYGLNATLVLQHLIDLEENYFKGDFWQTSKSLQESLGLSKYLISESLKSLIKGDLISIENKVREGSRVISKVYHFTLLKSNPTPLKKYDFHGICYQGRIGSRYLESNF